jgi:cobalt-zinc-cadmium efflux system membrane fusion protein
MLPENIIMFAKKLQELWEQLRQRYAVPPGALAVAIAIVAGGLLLHTSLFTQPETSQPKPVKGSGEVMLELNETQLSAFKLEKVAEQEFQQQRRSVGTIEFNQNRLVVVFAHYQGRIIEAKPNVGDFVREGEFLFSMQSPDLLAAVSNLITVSGTSVLHKKNLVRAQSLVKSKAISQQQADQVVSDQQSAEGAMKVARDNVRIFGKTDADIDKIIAERQSDSDLVVNSPITGVITARSAAPGQYVQPGVAPAPYTIADTSTMWMVANVVENDAPLLRVGQEISASVAAYPDKIFRGKIIVIGSGIDPITRRVFARCEIADPEHLLRAGMFAKFMIKINEPIKSPAVNQNGIVRETNGAMSAWTTTDNKHFYRKTVQIGDRQGENVQILSGLGVGETIVSDGAVFLSNQVAIRALE